MVDFLPLDLILIIYLLICQIHFWFHIKTFFEGHVNNPFLYDINNQDQHSNFILTRCSDNIAVPVPGAGRASRSPVEFYCTLFQYIGRLHD